MESKTEKVLNHLKRNGSITSLEAIYKYKATRLSAIIYTLRHGKGYNINNNWEKASDGTRYVRYHLIEDGLEGGSNVQK